MRVFGAPLSYQSLHSLLTDERIIRGRVCIFCGFAPQPVTCDILVNYPSYSPMQAVEQMFTIRVINVIGWVLARCLPRPRQMLCTPSDRRSPLRKTHRVLPTIEPNPGASSRPFCIICTLRMKSDLERMQARESCSISKRSWLVYTFKITQPRHLPCISYREDSDIFGTKMHALQSRCLPRVKRNWGFI